MSALTKMGKLFILMMIIIPNTMLIAAGDGAHSGVDITRLHHGLMFWSVVTFLIVLIVLKKTAWKPLIEGLKNREDNIRNNIEDAQNKQKEATEKLKEYENKLAQAEKEVKEIIAEGKKNAEAIKTKMIEDAGKECENIKVRAESDLKLAKQQAIEEIFKTAADLSIAISTKLIKKSLDEKQQNEIIEDTLKQFQESTILS